MVVVALLPAPSTDIALGAQEDKVLVTKVPLQEIAIKPLGEAEEPARLVVDYRACAGEVSGASKASPLHRGPKLHTVRYYG